MPKLRFVIVAGLLHEVASFVASVHGAPASTKAIARAPRKPHQDSSVVRHFDITERPGRFLEDEVPDDGLQKWVAWCEVREATGDDWEARIERRRKLLEEHQVWQRTNLLPSMTAQMDTESRFAPEIEDRPAEEKTQARILWETSLLSGRSMFPDGMCVCVAAASFTQFEALLMDDPFFKGGADMRGGPVFDHVETFKWTQANDAELRYDPFQTVPYLLLCKDKGADEVPGLRSKVRPDHLAFLKASQLVNKAGPLRPSSSTGADADVAPVGSLVLAHGSDAESVKKWAEGDPYATNGLFASVEVRRAKPMDVTGLYVLSDATSRTRDGGQGRVEEIMREIRQGTDEEDDDGEEEEAPTFPHL